MTAATSASTGATISVAGGAPLTVLEVRILTPWKGAWVVELDIDPGPDPTVVVPTSGSAVLTVGANPTLTGTVDPLATGRFVNAVGMRLVAGAGGWDQPVGKQDFANDAGIKSSTVEQATAKLVGETVVDSAPITLGVHWTRAAGPASRVFEDPDRDWYVDSSGVTQVASRPAATPDASLEILHYDPISQRVEVSCDALVLPGTTLTDPRFDGTLTVRKVEQTFSKDGSRATCWCSTVAVDPVLAMLTSLVRELAGVATLRVIPYRYVNASTMGRLNLQAVDKPQGEPDLQKVSVMGGMPGDSATLANSTGVLVLFVEGQKSKPVAFAFDGTVPLTRTVDAKNELDLGPSSAMVKIAGGSDFVALAGLVKTMFSDFATWVKTGVAPAGTAGGPVTWAMPAPTDNVAAQKTKAT